MNHFLRFFEDKFISKMLRLMLALSSFQAMEMREIQCFLPQDGGPARQSTQAASPTPTTLGA